MKHAKRLIVFFIPPEKLINGGIISIFSICKVTRELSRIHQSDVYIATYPGEQSYRKNDLFENDEVIYSFDEIVKLGTPESLLLHVPEYASWNTFQSLQPYKDYLGKIQHLQINILNQNILLMQLPHEVARWFSLTPYVTQTTAHTKYTNQSLADLYSIPTHYLSTAVDHSQYKWVPYVKKEDIIVLSPDTVEDKEKIVQKITKAFPTYQIITVQNMTYENYKKLLSRAKFTVGFGEGFDGYYTESFFSGGITFSVYNEDFFPDKAFSTYENTYNSYADMLKHIVSDMQLLITNTNLYGKINAKNLDKINSLYSFARYKENIKNFYLKRYTYLPNYIGSTKLLGAIIKDCIALETEKASLTQERDRLGHELGLRDSFIRERDKTINDMLNSRSWKITKFLRLTSGSVSKLKH